ncbi:unnamed protein product [Brassicogethes aeneus]|uniref:Cyclin-dependent kinase 20 n=1 Tax=Brassicogethes aeneus TaxID=1431903 RepID=A0A9P0AXI4_BRAAE|nr:unnamed protein product [Brassicogethes aeneus]
MNNFKLLGRAGEGAHGFVYKALDLRTNKIVAIKKIGINPDTGIPKNTMREICALKALKSEHIVKLFEVTAMGCAVVLVMEFLPCNLGDLLKSDLKLELTQIKSYMKMMLSGIDYMHSHKIMHRDIKPYNLLISDQGALKIADFGLARIYIKGPKRQYSHQVATRWYRSPELLYGSRTYTPSVDMWSVGCILGEMINKQPIFPGETDIEQLAIVLGTLGTPNEEIWPGLNNLPDYNKISFSTSEGKSWTSVIPDADEVTLDLIINLLVYDGNKRLTASEALDHTFFKKDPPPCALDKMPQAKDIKDSQVWNFDGFDDINIK